MVLPLFAEDSAVTAWPAPVLNTGVHEQAASVQLVFQPAVVTHTYWPPVAHTFAFCWSCTSGVTNLAAGSQSGLGLTPTVAWPTQVGLTVSKNECPPSVEEYIVPSVYSPTMSLPFCGLTITSKPSPPAASDIWLVWLLTTEVPLSCRPPMAWVPPPGSLPARAS